MEAQRRRTAQQLRNANLPYDLTRRGIYYAARLVTSQNRAIASHTQQRIRISTIFFIEGGTHEKLGSRH